MLIIRIRMPSIAEGGTLFIVSFFRKLVFMSLFVVSGAVWSVDSDGDDNGLARIDGWPVDYQAALWSKG